MKKNTERKEEYIKLEHRKRLGDVYEFCFILDMGKSGVAALHSNVFVFKCHRRVQQKSGNRTSTGKGPVSPLIRFYCG